MTPRQFYLLLDRQKESIDHQKALAGVIAATVANFSMGAPKQPLKPMDFFESRARKRKVTREETERSRMVLMSLSRPAAA